MELIVVVFVARDAFFFFVKLFPKKEKNK